MALPRRTIYVRDEDQDIWERAAAITGEESLSSFVTEALRRLILTREQQAGQSPYKRIELLVGAEDPRTGIISSNRTVAFTGRCIVQGPIEVYETPKHRLLFYYRESGYGFYAVYESLEEAAGVESEATGDPFYSPDLIAKVAEALGHDWVEELDI